MNKFGDAPPAPNSEALSNGLPSAFLMRLMNKFGAHDYNPPPLIQKR